MAFVAALQSLPSWGFTNLMWPLYRRAKPYGLPHPWCERVPGLVKWHGDASVLTRVFNLAVWWFLIWSVIKVIIWLTA